MEILPAIDIKDGRAVRLYQGDYAQVTVFADSVVDSGRRWQDEGARWLHVVDLDGARAGHPVNTDLILALRRALTLQIEVGGGLRSAADITRLLDSGIDRVVLGTAALHDPALLDLVLARDPAALVVALDARDGRVATAGWLETGDQQATTVAQRLATRGVRLFSHTDIARDGALSGPNYTAVQAVQAALSAVALSPTDSHAPDTGAVQLIAGGGIANLEQIRTLRRMGLAGAILGRALYTGALQLPAALRAAALTEEEGH